MKNIIYIIKNTINNKAYIGQTWQSLKNRWHCGYKYCTHLDRAIKKYGEDKFYYEILKICETQDDADFWECFFINQFDSINNGYNLRAGGSRGRHSEISKQKMSNSAIKRNVAGEKNPNYGNHKLAGKNHPLYGKTRTNEEKEKISKTKRERKNSIGIKNGRAKLTENDVIEIRKAHNSGITIKFLAKKYNLSFSTIYSIIKRKLWKHI
jgi:group I intron endonuclease